MDYEAAIVGGNEREWFGGKELLGTFFSNGWQTSRKQRDVLEPATGRVLAKVGMANPDDVASASKTARAAQEEWSAASYEVRADRLRDAARIAHERRGNLVAWLVRESASTQPKAEFEVSLTVKCLYEAAAMASQAAGLVLPSHRGRLSIAKRRPIGVVGVIAPFNFPLYLAMRAVAPALAVGNAVVLKPDPRTAVCGGLNIAKLFELAGLPEGVLHVLSGDSDVGAALCADPNIGMIQFTGSTAAGRKVGEAAGRHLKKLSLELGGKNAFIVLDDADLELAANNAAWSTFLHSGQICMSAGRILVQASVAETFTKLLSDKAAKLTAGDPVAGAAALGPLISDGQARNAETIVAEAVASGASLAAGGTVSGPFFAPTVLSHVRKGMRAYEEEMFAPVAAITTFETDDEAVALANDTEFGLSAAIQTRSIGRGMALGERLRVGLLHINDSTVNDEAVNPFGGVGASGNGTSIGGPANWEEFTQWQWMTVKDTPPSYHF